MYKFKGTVKRVYKTAGSYIICSEDVTTKEGKTIRFSQFGASYKDWLDGEEPKPIEDLHCPLMHTNQNLQTEDVNGLYKTRCLKNLVVGSWISNCKCFNNKDKCWKIFKGE